MAAADSRLTLNEHALDKDMYQALLDTCDLMLCPYDRGFYGSMQSGIVTECAANAIPVVVPADMTFVTEAAKYGASITTFAETTPASILEATQLALDQFDTCATQAYRGAKTWAEIQGPGKFVDGLLKIVSGNHPR